MSLIGYTISQVDGHKATISSPSDLTCGWIIVSCYVM